ncbi:hypothetical protein HZH66_003067 [Vespula vulgaris]|uniref:Uncharacterized protein n=1 Tax=Vespula vulgaris TaxID=7454 RepID=A0A834NGU5_VESVU|nr:hypothetical protein HZH66_003067 [Vespula vulgaris]
MFAMYKTNLQVSSKCYILVIRRVYNEPYEYKITSTLTWNSSQYRRPFPLARRKILPTKMQRDTPVRIEYPESVNKSIDRRF